MGRVTYDKLAVGTTSASGLNTILTAVSDETATLDSNNYAEEGFDYRVFEANISTDIGFTSITHTTQATQALTTTWATLDPGGVKTFQSGAITLGSNEILRVIARIDFPSNNTREGIPIDGDLELRLRRSVSASPAVIASSVRRVFMDSTEITSTTGGPARVTLLAKIDGPLAMDWVDVQIRDASGTNVTVQVGRATLYGTIFKRITV